MIIIIFKGNSALNTVFIFISFLDIISSELKVLLISEIIFCNNETSLLIIIISKYLNITAL